MNLIENEASALGMIRGKYFFFFALKILIYLENVKFESKFGPAY